MSQATIDEQATSEIPEPAGKWQSFWQGCTECSTLGTLGALVLPALQLIWVVMYFTPQTIARWDAGYFLNNRYDNFTQSAFDIQRMRYSSPASNGVLIVGSSTLREAIYDPTILANELTSEFRETTDVHWIATGWQSMWETAAVVDHLPEGFQGVVVIGVDPGRFGRSRKHLELWLEDPLIPIDSPHFREEIARLGLRRPESTGYYLLDHARFFSTRRKLPLRLVGGPVRYEPHFTAAVDTWAEEKWQQAVNGDLQNWIKTFDQHGQENLAVLERIVRRVQQSGNQVVLLETPLHPRAVAACGEAYPAYQQAMASYAERVGVPYWNLDGTANIEAEDFCDWVHLKTKDAQMRYQQALQEQLIPVFKTMHPKKGTLHETS